MVIVDPQWLRVSGLAGYLRRSLVWHRSDGEGAISQVIVAGWIDWDPAHRDLALAALREAARHSRAEPGCLDYSMTADPDDDARIRVFEHWVSAQALDEHLRTGHIARFRASAADLVRTGRSLSTFEVAVSGAP